MDPPENEPRGRGHVVIEMVEMHGPAFVPAAQPVPIRDARMHRITPVRPDRAMDGGQGPPLVVADDIRLRNQLQPAENEPTRVEQRRAEERDRRRDEQLRSRCPTFPRQLTLIFGLLVSSLIALYLLFKLLFGDDPPPRYKGDPPPFRLGSSWH